ncbi:NADH dehydrogenase [ubiquinone] 1 alpha subcomplex subunit 11-like [Leptidea sinapis]|uniref:NADH dehydrogenase [ubiquinone] 1 alpha subcomplex subunit 11-like n=1 Tax=Leptidea sinapis TaxID=189913 RepID=UPI0021220827|nr:NADH dehydrogenase [ubiquinone] 1 alpha subcomplex subunit 11-like [Leptidea sinapis]
MSCDCKEEQKKGREGISRTYYGYYDTPEGCNIDKKMMSLARYGAAIGAIISTYDVLMYSRAVGFIPMLKRYMFHSGSLMLMGATFAAVANGALLFRKKDDHLNYFLGGFACGPIMAYYFGTNHMYVVGGLFAGAVAAVQKEALVHGHQLVPHVQGHMGLVNSWRNDFTLLADPRDEMQHTCDKKN